MADTEVAPTNPNEERTMSGSGDLFQNACQPRSGADGQAEKLRAHAVRDSQGSLARVVSLTVAATDDWVDDPRKPPTPTRA